MFQMIFYCQCTRKKKKKKKKTFSWNSQLPDSTEVFWCLFTMFILFEINKTQLKLIKLSSVWVPNGITAWHKSCETDCWAARGCLGRGACEQTVCCWVCPCLRCQQCLQLTSSTHLSEQEGAAGSQQAEVKLNPRISQIKKLSLYSMDQRNSCAAGSCNSSVPHWISLGGKTEPALNEVFLILPMFPFPGLR